MPVRNISSQRYFYELSNSAEKYFIPYISTLKPVVKGLKVLEFGCGQGGILLPFARIGCEVTGVDLNVSKIEDGRELFEEEGLTANLIADDLFNLTNLENSFDIIICHDIIEHLSDKQGFMVKIRNYIKADGVIFFGFPAWQMPFGGHQQNCKSAVMSHWPFVHLLPESAYRWLLKVNKESESTIAEMLDIKKTATPIELFEKVVKDNGLSILNRTLYFINPHYEIKFGMRPRVLWKCIAAIPKFRNLFSTSCWYLIGR